jgi:hypothetical protein
MSKHQSLQWRLLTGNRFVMYEQHAISDSLRSEYRAPLETQAPSDLAHAAVENSLFIVSTSASCRFCSRQARFSGPIRTGLPSERALGLLAPV